MATKRPSTQPSREQKKIAVRSTRSLDERKAVISEIVAANATKSAKYNGSITPAHREMVWQRLMHGEWLSQICRDLDINYSCLLQQARMDPTIRLEMREAREIQMETLVETLLMMTFDPDIEPAKLNAITRVIEFVAGSYNKALFGKHVINENRNMNVNITFAAGDKDLC